MDRFEQLFRNLQETSSQSDRRAGSDSSRRVKFDHEHDATWIGPGEHLSLHGFEIPNAMVYVGNRLASWNGRIEPSLIDIKLRANPKTRTKPIPHYSYWHRPAYRELTVEQRSDYLGWLAGGRRDRSVEIGFVFLFLYGLERRVVVDIIDNPALADELPAIRAEMSALQDLYGSVHPTFHYHGKAFLDLIDSALADDPDWVPPIELDADRWYIPTPLRVALGRRATAGTTVPADLALAWAWYVPEHSPRTTALRCLDVFRRLWTIRFNEQFPHGLPVRPKKSTVKVTYHAANSGLGQVSFRRLDVPDVFVQKIPVRSLLDLFQAVTAELSRYSRWLSRNPQGENTLPGLISLPTALMPDALAEASYLHNWVNRLLGKQSQVTITGADVLKHWGAYAPKKLSLTDAESLGHALGLIGLGIEPDVRFGGPPLAADAPAVLFQQPIDAPQIASPNYPVATLLAHIAHAAGFADAEKKPDLVSQTIESSFDLIPSERTRLQAYRRLLSTTTPKLTGLKRRVEVLNEDERYRIGALLIQIVAADGTISPAKVTTLTKLYRVLELDESRVTSDIHAQMTNQRPRPATTPVIVRPIGETDPGYPIPSPTTRKKRAIPTTSAPTIDLDETAISAKMRDSDHVAALLHDIFAEPEDEVQPQSAPTNTPARQSRDNNEMVSTIGNLDRAHSQLLRAISAQTEWPRHEFADLAAGLGLLPDGALDTLNEAAFDAADEPLLDGDAILTVNPDVLVRLLA